ncbi:MAG: glycosyltransferase [Acidobacteria bacterium]|nr:glycosyltransferase [Acidobacteriota bacterium]
MARVLNLPRASAPVLADPPLVSCVMPTADRLEFVPEAIRQFCAQTYPNKELWILDDGRESCAHLVPQQDNIHYRRLNGPLDLGSKRNLAVGLANGSLIAHWDDDDWFHPRRLSEQVVYLNQHEFDLVGQKDLLFWEPEHGKAYRYHSPAVTAWVAGGTFLYRKSLWQQSPFPAIRIGEDNAFVSQVPPGKCGILNQDLVVARIHNRNTSVKNTKDRYWHPYPAEKVADLLTQWRSPSQGRVVVSVPSYNADPELLMRAVSSILNQTHRNLFCVVVNDGGHSLPAALKEIQDPRLHCVDRAENCGRYAVDDWVLHQFEGDYFAVQDSDDWSEPTRFERLLPYLTNPETFAVICANWYHGPHGQKLESIGAPSTHRLEHFANHFGLFKRKALMAVGGYDGGFRLGYDTYLVNLFALLGGLAHCQEALYHRCHRSGSLTTHPSTGLTSQKRQSIYRQLNQRYLKVRQCLQAKPSAGPTQKLALYAQHFGVQPHPQSAPIQVIQSWDDWCLANETLDFLDSQLEQDRPRALLELGSGASTLLFARYAQQAGARLVSLEHDPAYMEKTRSRLRQAGLLDSVDLLLAPLETGAFGPMYTFFPHQTFDFVLIDGPPMARGREGTYPALRPCITPRGKVWLDDAKRQHERNCVQAWSERFGDFACNYWPVGKGLMSWSRSAKPLLTITLLCGGRPGLLNQTLAAFEQNIRGQVPFRALALVNAQDRESLAQLEAMGCWDIDWVEQGCLDIGAAVSRLWARVDDQAPFVFHLEDDWQTARPAGEQFRQAIGLFNANPDLGQVRMRSVAEPVLSYHMVSGKRIEWRTDPSRRWKSSVHAHFTFNPSVFRQSLLAKMFPVQGEAQAQKRFLAEGLQVAQLLPGNFVHLGGSQSLRLARNQ